MVKTKFRTLKDLYENTQEIHLDYNDQYYVQIPSNEANNVIQKDCLRKHSEGSSEQEDSSLLKLGNSNDTVEGASSVNHKNKENLEVEAVNIVGNTDDSGKLNVSFKVPNLNKLSSELFHTNNSDRIDVTEANGEQSEGPSDQVEHDDSGTLNPAFRVPDLNEPYLEASSAGPDVVESVVPVFDVPGNVRPELSFSEKSRNEVDQMFKDLWTQDNLMKHEQNDFEDGMGPSWEEETDPKSDDYLACRPGFEVSYLSDVYLKDEDERAYKRLREETLSGERLLGEGSSYNVEKCNASRTETLNPSLELSLEPINRVEDIPESLNRSLACPFSDCENVSRGV